MRDYYLGILIMKSYKQVANYILKEQIGQGNFATVFLATKDSDSQDSPKKFAVKCLDKSLINDN